MGGGDGGEVNIKKDERNGNRRKVWKAGVGVEGEGEEHDGKGRAQKGEGKGAEGGGRPGRKWVEGQVAGSWEDLGAQLGGERRGRKRKWPQRERWVCTTRALLIPD